MPYKPERTITVWGEGKIKFVDARVSIKVKQEYLDDLRREIEFLIKRYSI